MLAIARLSWNQRHPSPLSALEAKERLREIVEGFFFRRRNDRGQPPARHLLVKSPPGPGKTKEAMEWATRYQTREDSKDGSFAGDTPVTEVDHRAILREIATRIFHIDCRCVGDR